MEIKPNEKIRVRLESFNHELLNTSCQKIMEITQGNNIDNVGVVSLPTDKRIYCVLRSPHVNKDSREHFEIRTHKRILEISYDSWMLRLRRSRAIERTLVRFRIV